MKAIHFVVTVLLGLVLCGTVSLANLVQFPNGGAPPPAYSGAGDVQAFSEWYSCTFAYSSGSRGTKACQLCNGGVCADVSSDATTGIVPNAPTINGAACNNTTHICKIAIAYDKASTVDISQATDAQRPAFVVDGYAAGIPCASYSRASSQYLFTNIGLAPTQPYLISAVAKANATGVAGNIFGDSVNTQLQIGPNVALSYDGGAAMSVALTDTNWGAINAIYNGASSYIRANAATNSGVNVGTAQMGANQFWGAYNGIGTNQHDGMICEMGVAIVSSSAVADALNTNQHSAGRYNF